MVALFVFFPEAAVAHITREGAAGFGAGFSHPLTGIDHFLAMFAVGVWGAQRGGRSVWTLPILFPMIMVLGGIAGMAGLEISGVEFGIALSVVVLGGAILAAWHPWEWVALLIVAVFAVCHGYAHGAELPRASDPADYAVGFVVATGLIHILGIAVGIALLKLLSGRVARGLGGAIALGGVYFLVAA